MFFGERNECMVCELSRFWMSTYSSTYAYALSVRSDQHLSDCYPFFKTSAHTCLMDSSISNRCSVVHMIAGLLFLVVCFLGKEINVWCVNSLDFGCQPIRALLLTS